MKRKQLMRNRGWMIQHVATLASVQRSFAFLSHLEAVWTKLKALTAPPQAKRTGSHSKRKRTDSQRVNSVYMGTVEAPQPMLQHCCRRCRPSRAAGGNGRSRPGAAAPYGVARRGNIQMPMHCAAADILTLPSPLLTSSLIQRS
eukprot:2070151-Pleurochrysis_carterae.AAC.8